MDGIPLHFPRFPHGFGDPPFKEPRRPSDARPVPPWAPQKGDFFDGSETATVGLLRCPRDVSTREMVGKFKENLYIYIYIYIPFLIPNAPPNTKNRRPYPENFRLANLIFNRSPLENNLKINLPFVGSPPNTKN